MITHVKRLGRRFNGTLVTTAFLPLFFVLMLLGNGAFVFALAYLSWGVASVTQQTYYGAIGDVTSANSRNRAFALLEVTYSVGIMVAGFAAGALYEWSPRYPLWVALAGSCIALAGAVLVRRRLIAGTPAAGVVAELVPAA